MNLTEMIGVAIIGKILGDLFGGSKKPNGSASPIPPQPPAPTSPPVSAKPKVPKPSVEPKPPQEPKPLPAKPTDIKWPDASRLPPDFKPVVIIDPATGLNEPATSTVPPSRQPNKGKPEPVYVPPPVTTSPSPHKPGGYTPPQPQVKQQKGQAVSQTEEAAVIARERNPTNAYWMPAKKFSPAEAKAAKEQLAKWRKGFMMFYGPRTFLGRRMFRHVMHGQKKAVEIWQPKPPFV